jgi:hypothetical protein
MKNDKNFKKEKRLVKTVSQARTVLNMFLLDSQKLNIEREISGLIEKLENPKLDLLMDRYPDLLQHYDLKELLSGNIEIADENMQDLKRAGLLSCLQLLLHFSYELKENPNPSDKRFDNLRYILSSITSRDFVHELLIMVISVVGVNYYEKFQKRIQNLDIDLEDTRVLESDPELQPHIDLMAWFALTRLFLESIYTYFSNNDHNLKNTKS